MKKFVLLGLFLSSLVWASEASVYVKLSPAGNFTGKTDEVKGTAKVVGSKVLAQNIIVNLKSLKTGMALRDKHTQDYLKTSAHPTAVLLKAEGENGKGKGVIRIKGIEKVISGTYKILGKNILAEFPLKLSDFKIAGIRYMGVGVKDLVTIRVQVPVQ